MRQSSVLQGAAAAGSFSHQTVSTKLMVMGSEEWQGMAKAVQKNT